MNRDNWEKAKRAADFSAALRHKYKLLFSLTRHDLPESARNCRDFSQGRRRAARETRNVHPRGPWELRDALRGM